MGKIIRPRLKINVYGPAGTGKSYFARTMPSPSVVLCFDPRGKDATYWEDADSIEEGELDLGTAKDGTKLVIPHVTLFDAAGKILRRIEYIHEDHLVFGSDNQDNQDFLSIKGWSVVTRLRRRLNQIFSDERDFWETMVWDSTTSALLAIQGFQKYVQNPSARGEAQKKWWGEATNELESILATRFASWPKNLVVISHTDKDKAADESGGVLRYTPRLPGRLASDLSTYYPEVYHSMVKQNDKGETTYHLQTRPSDLYTAVSQTVGAPNPCANNYLALWENYDLVHKPLKVRGNG